MHWQDYYEKAKKEAITMLMAEFLHRCYYVRDLTGADWDNPWKLLAITEQETICSDGSIYSCFAQNEMFCVRVPFDDTQTLEKIAAARAAIEKQKSKRNLRFSRRIATEIAKNHLITSIDTSDE